MDKKELQKQRMMKYFIDATKALMKQEEMKDISVRKIADLAGYSYATLYNYFRDLDHLLWYVIIDIFDELAEKLQETTADERVQGLDIVKEYSRTYIDYFLENQNAFKLAFINHPGTPPEDILPSLKQPIIGKLVAEMISKCIADEKKAAIIGEILTGMVHGLLLFHINRQEIDKERLYECMNNACELLLKRP